jgi:hypothetical protein
MMQELVGLSAHLALIRSASKVCIANRFTYRKYPHTFFPDVSYVDMELKPSRVSCRLREKGDFISE